MREGVAVSGVGRSSRETPTLVEPPLNLVLYMYLRIFVYSSNILMVTFEPMDSILASGTLKNQVFPWVLLVEGAGSRYEGDLLHLSSLTL